ncbi:hypothetical protein CBM2610_B10109 [Cupriavidus taiwanensis]|nr:hypothetical protein CBM2610_B10109 [Cupriavidus taiwanensis]
MTPRRTWCAPHSVRTPPRRGFLFFVAAIAVLPFPLPLRPPAFSSFHAPRPDGTQLAAASPRFAETGTQCCSAGRQAPGRRSQKRVRGVPLMLTPAAE